MEEFHVCCFFHSMFAEHRFPSEAMAILGAMSRRQWLMQVVTWCGRNCVTFIHATVVQSRDTSHNSGCTVDGCSQRGTQDPPFSHHLAEGTFNCHSTLTDGLIVSFLGRTVASVRGIERCQQVFGWCACVVSNNVAKAWKTFNHFWEA